MDGYLREVVSEPLGSTLAADASAGATIITLDPSTEFAEDGGDLSLNGQAIEFESASYADDGTVTVAFAAGESLDDPAVTGDFAALLNPNGTEAKNWIALVELPGAEQPVEATIPLTLIDQFPEGDSLAGSVVTVDDDGAGAGGYIVANRPSELPTESAATAPPTENITVKGVVGDATGLTAVAEGVPAQTTYLEWYIDGVLKGTTTSLVFRFTSDSAGDPFIPDTDYAVTVKPVNIVGAGTLSAAVSGRLNPGVSAETVLGYVAAGFVLAGAIQVGAMTITAPTGDDPGGILIPLTNGGTIHFPADGSDAVITAILRARSLVVDDNLTLNGALNQIFGTVFLAAGINPPSTKPAATTTWEAPAAHTDADNAQAFIGQVNRGLFDNASEWIYAQDNGSSQANGAICSIAKSDGSVTVLADESTFTGFRPYGVVKIGTVWFVLVLDTVGAATWRVQRFDASWNFLTEWTPVALAGDNQGLTPTIATDGTDVWLVRQAGPLASAPTDPDRHIIRKFSTGGTQDTSATLVVNLTGGTTRANLVGAYVGSADFGALRHVAVSTAKVFVINSAGTRQTAQEWTPANGYTMFGIGWDGTRFSTAANGSVWHYSQVVSGTSRSITYTWYDNDGTTHESTPSPALTYTQPPRQWLKVTTDTPADMGGADDPNAVRIYVANKRQTDLATGATAAVYDLPGTGGAAAPTSNGFDSVASPGILRSQAVDSSSVPLIRLKGDGSTRLGDITTDTAGRANLDREVGTNSTTTTSGNITAESFRLAAAFTGRTNQRYLIRVTVNLRNNTANGRSTVRIKWDTASTGTSGTTILTAQVSHPATTSIVTTHEYTGEFTYTGTDLASLFGKITVEATNGTTVADAANFGPTRVSVHAIATP